MQKYLYLVVASISEVAGAAALKTIEGFTELVTSCDVALGYSIKYELLINTVAIYKALGCGWDGKGEVVK